MAINVENVRRVRDLIAQLEAGRFDMTVWAARTSGVAEVCAEDVVPTLLHDCNTAACIGGWTEALLGTPETGADDDTIVGKYHFGMTEDEAGALFYPNAMPRRTQAEAVAVLDRLIETGKVDWDYAIAKVAADSPASHVAEREG